MDSIRLNLKDFGDHVAYNLDDGTGGLDNISILELFLSNTYPASCLRMLEEESLGYIGEFTELDWLKDKNIVTITRSWEYFEDDEESFVMKFDSFKKMIEDWSLLWKKRVPEIYFIMDDQGGITVRESLEEK